MKEKERVTEEKVENLESENRGFVTFWIVFLMLLGAIGFIGMIKGGI